MRIEDVLKGHGVGVGGGKEHFVAIEDGESYGGAVQASVILGGYIYIGGVTNQRVWKIDIKSNTKVSETVVLGTIDTLATDGTYIYASYGQVFVKINPTNMSVIGTSASYGSRITAMEVCEGYVFVVGQTSNAVRKYDSSTLAVAATGYITPVTIMNALTCLDGYVFVEHNRIVYKMDMVTMSIIAQSSTNLANRALVNDGNAIFSSYQRVIYKLDAITLSVIAETMDSGVLFSRIGISNKYVFGGGGSNIPIKRYNLSLDFIDESVRMSVAPQSISTKNNIIILALGAPLNTIRKLAIAKVDI